MFKSDLHIHTTASDSLFSPSEVIKWANTKNIRILSITDHDTVNGIYSAIQEAKLYNIIIIPGIEISCNYDGEEIHILGYYIDYQSQVLFDATKKLVDSRLYRGERIVNNLIDMGIKISLEQVKRLAGKGVIGRPHIARALIENGYINNIEEGFSEFLGRDCPAYVDRFKLSIIECINLIHRIGGVAVLAHPGLIKNKRILDEIIKYGIDGIEVFHSKHSCYDINDFTTFADTHDLIKTGGSDCHGILKNNNPLLGEFGTPIEQIEKLKEKASYYKKRSVFNDCN